MSILVDASFSVIVAFSSLLVSDRGSRLGAARLHGSQRHSTPHCWVFRCQFNHRLWVGGSCLSLVLAAAMP